MARARQFTWQAICIIALLALIVGLGLGRFWQSRSSPTPSVASNTALDAKQAVLTVEAISPTMNTVVDSISASGVIAGKEVAAIGAKVSGVAIEQILVEVGDTVQAGQVLAVLDDSSISQQVAIADAELTRAQIALDKARTDLLRVEPLIAIDAISREQYDGFVAAKAQAETQVRALEAQRASTKLSERHTQVLAPVAGVISQRNAQVGQLTSGAPLFEIVKNGVLEWQASVAPSVATKIGIGQRAVLSLADTTVGATVTRIAPVANNSRELTVHATVDDSSLLASGMYVPGEFLLSTKTVATVPYQVVTISDGLGYVWTLHPQDNGLYTAKRTQIPIDKVGDDIAVTLPLQTLIVKEGGNFLQEGDSVQLAKPSAQAQSASPMPSNAIAPSDTVKVAQ